MDTTIFAAQPCIRNMLGGLASDVVQQVKMPTDKPEALSLILRSTEWKVLWPLHVQCQMCVHTHVHKRNASLIKKFKIDQVAIMETTEVYIESVCICLLQVYLFLWITNTPASYGGCVLAPLGNTLAVDRNTHKLFAHVLHHSIMKWHCWELQRELKKLQAENVHSSPPPFFLFFICFLT